MENSTLSLIQCWENALSWEHLILRHSYSWGHSSNHAAVADNFDNVFLMMFCFNNIRRKILQKVPLILKYFEDPLTRQWKNIYLHSLILVHSLTLWIWKPIFFTSFKIGKTWYDARVPNCWEPKWRAKIRKWGTRGVQFRLKWGTSMRYAIFCFRTSNWHYKSISYDI